MKASLILRAQVWLRSRKILHQLLGERAAALHHRAGFEVGDAGAQDAFWTDAPVLVKTAVFNRHQAQGQQAGHFIKLDQHPVFTVLRVNAADQHRVEAGDGDRLAAARLGNTGHPVIGKADRQRRGVLRSVPEVEGARVNVNLLGIALDEAADAFKLGERAIAQAPQFIGECAGADISAGIELQRRRVDLRRQGPPGPGELAAYFAVKPDQCGGEHQRAHAADHDQHGEQRPGDAAHQRRLRRFLAGGATCSHPSMVSHPASGGADER